MPPTLITSDRERDPRVPRRAQATSSSSRCYGNGGAGVFRVKPDDENLGSLLEMFTAFYREPVIVQRYCPRCARATSASSWSTANSPAPSTACRRRRGALQHACRRPAGTDPR
jgi:hypothetical protein